MLGHAANAVPIVRLAVELHLDDGNVQGARDWLDIHERDLRQTNAVVGRAQNALLWSRYNAVAGDRASAHAYAVQAVEHASYPRQPLALVAAHRWLGELRTELGDLETAEAQLRSSLAVAEVIGVRSEIALTKLAPAELSAVRCDANAARASLAEVCAVFEPLVAVRTLERSAALEQRLR